MTGLWLAEAVGDAFHGWLSFGFAMTAAFAAAVRGYTGFGLSALFVASLSLILEPVEIVPCVVLLEIAASMAMLPGLWRQVDWPGLGRLLADALVGTPPGVALLAYLPAAPMRAGISVAVLAASLGLWRGLTLGRPARGGESVALGGLSGFVNGSTSVGGLPVVLNFLATETAAASTRASAFGLPARGRPGDRGGGHHSRLVHRRRGTPPSRRRCCSAWRSASAASWPPAQTRSAASRWYS